MNMYNLPIETQEELERMRKRRIEQDLVRMIRRGKAYVDIETGDVYQATQEVFAQIGQKYLGTLRRKAIPNRRRLEREARERSRLENESGPIQKPKRIHLEGEAGIFLLMAMAEEKRKRGDFYLK